MQHIKRDEVHHSRPVTRRYKQSLRLTYRRGRIHPANWENCSLQQECSLVTREYRLSSSLWVRCRGSKVAITSPCIGRLVCSCSVFWNRKKAQVFPVFSITIRDKSSKELKRMVRLTLRCTRTYNSILPDFHEEDQFSRFVRNSF